MSEQPVAPGTMGGIYALIDLGGAPLDPRDMSVLPLCVADTASCAMRAIDAITPDDAHSIVEQGRTTVFLGRLDEPEVVADRLGLQRSTPQPLLARTALDSFGTATPDVLLGEWTMLDYAPEGPVTMLVGIGGRMPLLYVRSGDRLAIAPSIHVLSRLGWVGRTLDDEAFLRSLTNCMPDDEQAQQTILRGVRRVPRGAVVTVSRNGDLRTRVTDPFVAVARWTGSRADAMAEAEALLRHIVRQRLARSPAPGLLLSGGLDSSLLAWALAAEGPPPMPALSSAVAPGRGVADETPYAAMVADTLALPLHRVVPAEVNVYRPAHGTLVANNVPPLSPRDYVYAAFADTAAALGVTELFDGVHGELTFTALMTVRSWRDVPRIVARGARDAWRGRRRASLDPVDAVLEVALAGHRRESTAPVLTAAVAAQTGERSTRNSGEPWGYSIGSRPPLRRDVTEQRAGQLRFARPFHDIRLLRLFAGFPARFMVGEGMTRWPARAVLSGRLPDSIVRRPKGMAFSPDYELRLVEQAPAAMARIATFRASDCDEWFDLAWLREELERVAAGTLLDYDELLRVQMTAYACEFLTWWRSGGAL